MFLSLFFLNHIVYPLLLILSQSIIDALKEAIPEKREQVKRLRTEHGNKVLGECTVTQVGGFFLFCSPPPSFISLFKTNVAHINGK